MSDIERRPRVALIFTGGTIDSVGVDRLDLAFYIEAGQRLEDGELVARIPELTSIADVEEKPFRRLPSQSIMDTDLFDLVSLIHQIFDEDRADGVVITHGTNTLEETAYFLHLTIKRDRPVIVVGAMRPASAISADGYLNLLNGARVAAADTAVGMGVLVVLNDTFQGRDLGPLGFADNDGRVILYHRPLRAHTTATEFNLTGIDALPRVDVVVSYLGADGVMIDAAVAAGARGIVQRGYRGRSPDTGGRRLSGSSGGSRNRHRRGHPRGVRPDGHESRASA